MEDPDLNRNIISGKRIKYLREHCGFSQSNIASFLGVDQSLISRVEKDERPLSSDLIEKLAALLGVHVSTFSVDSTEMPIPFALRSGELTCEDMTAISSINRIALNCDSLASLLKGSGTEDVIR